HFLGRCSAAYVQEVGRLAAEQLDRVHGGHGQACAVDQAANIPVKLDISQVKLAGFDFGRLFFGQIAVLDDFGVTVQGVGIKVELGVQRDDVARIGQDQRVDLGERGVGVPVCFVELLEFSRCLFH